MSRRAKNAQQREKSAKAAGHASRRLGNAANTGELPANYWQACELVRTGEYEKARGAYARLERSAAAKADLRLRVLIQNDLAVLAAMEGKFDEACQVSRTALGNDNECLPARLNLGLVEAELTHSGPMAGTADVEIAAGQEAVEPVAFNPGGGF